MDTKDNSFETWQATSWDYIIAGNGLAGSMLSYYLMKLGCKVLVVDKSGPSSTKVAGGLFNPLTGRRMTRTWMVDEIFPFAEESYQEMEKLLNASFYHTMPLIRIFPSEDEKKANLKRLIVDNKEVFVEAFLDEIPVKGIKTFSYGGCEIKGTGYVDTAVYIEAYSQYLRKLNILIEDEIIANNIHLQADGVEWKGIKAKRIIFCDGYKGITNPYFKKLPFNLAKGELLTIKAPGLISAYIISKSIFILPIGEGLFRVGSTYEWNELDEYPTEKGLNEIKRQIDGLIDVPYEVVAHEAGIRPAVNHRRPFLGMHPLYSNIGIFNGLGTKGVTLAPYLAWHLAAHLEKGDTLLEEVDIKQFSELLNPTGQA